MAELDISPALQGLFAGRDPFEVAATLPGEMFREMPGRRTLRFEYAGKRYFLKYHGGVGWGEILKNVVTGKPPVLGAENEMRAIRALTSLGIPTMTLVAYGKRGLNPARQQSFVITEALENTESLEDVCMRWGGVLPEESVWKPMVDMLACYAATLHSHGIAHQDFYICHFLVGCGSSVSADARLIDLHRALVTDTLSRRSIIKDVSAVFYSLAEIGLCQHQVCQRFISEYERLKGRQGAKFWGHVRARVLDMLAGGIAANRVKPWARPPELDAFRQLP